MAVKHIPVNVMLQNKDYDASDIANYALYNKDGDHLATANMEDLINALLNKESENMTSNDDILPALNEATKWESVLTDNQRSNMPYNQARGEVAHRIFTKLITKP